MLSRAVAAISCESRRNEHAKGVGMIREQAGSGERGSENRAGAEASEADILLRIATLVGEIDALKRERHAEPVLGARARLASTYFTKRRDTNTAARRETNTAA
jgi:hypothetical protein